MYFNYLHGEEDVWLFWFVLVKGFKYSNCLKSSKFIEDLILIPFGYLNYTLSLIACEMWFLFWVAVLLFEEEFLNHLFEIVILKKFKLVVKTSYW